MYVTALVSEAYMLMATASQGRVRPPRKNWSGVWGRREKSQPMISMPIR